MASSRLAGVPGLLGLAACLASCLLAACGPPVPAEPAPGIELSWQIAPDPPVAGPVRLSLRLTDAATRRPVPGATVRLEANMSHPGMQPVFATAREVSPGTYVAAFELTMGGDWFLLVDAGLADGGTLHRQVDLPGVRSR